MREWKLYSGELPSLGDVFNLPVRVCFMKLENFILPNHYCHPLFVPMKIPHDLSYSIGETGREISNGSKLGDNKVCFGISKRSTVAAARAISL